MMDYLIRSFETSSAEQSWRQGTLGDERGTFCAPVRYKDHSE